MMTTSHRREDTAPRLAWRLKDDLSRVLDVADYLLDDDQCRYRGPHPFARSPRRFAELVMRAFDNSVAPAEAKQRVHGLFDELRALARTTPLHDLDGELVLEFFEQHGALVFDPTVAEDAAPVSLDVTPKPYAVGVSYAAGDVIQHPKFGVGVVRRVAEGKIEIAFGAEIRRLAL